VPALVIHGLQDALIPPANGRLLAAQLRRARLLELPEASHWVMTDSTAACVAALQEHLHANRVTA
jgi:pimeloyl-ACP methyl ester carboxylesterase